MFSFIHIQTTKNQSLCLDSDGSNFETLDSIRFKLWNITETPDVSNAVALFSIYILTWKV